MSSENSYGYPATMTGGSQRSGTHFLDYWHLILKNVPWVLLFLCGSVSTAMLISNRQTEMYRAEAVIEIVPPKVGGGEFLPGIVRDPEYLATQIEKLKMGPLIERAVEDQKLAEQADFEGMTQSEIVRAAKGNVDVRKRRGSYLVNVDVVGEKPEILDDLTNALIHSFADSQRDESRKMRDAAKATLRDKIDNLEAQIRLQTADKQNQLSGHQWTEATFTVEYSRLNRDLGAYTDEIGVKERRIIEDKPVAEFMRDVIQQNPETWMELLRDHPIVLDSPSIQKIDTDDLLVKLRMEQLKEEFGESAPKVKLARARLQELSLRRAQLQRAIINNFLQAYDNNIDTLQNLKHKKDLIETELQTATRVNAKLDAINSQISLLADDRQAAQRELERIQSASLNVADSIRIVARAQEPGKPYAPNHVLNMVLGVIFGLVGGIALAFLLDYLDDSIRTKDELAKIADVPLLGIIPNIEARKNDTHKKDLYAFNQPKSTIAEAYRGVRTALTLSARGPEQKVLLLTSAGPKEGKSTTAINLTTVLAYSGARTLLIDADLRKPRLHKSFEVPNTRGLTNCIVSDDDPVDYCLRTKAENVDLLPCGPIPPNPSELLGRPRMHEILSRLREEYDHVVVDTPPIGAVTDAAILATIVDGVILVVHAGKTRKQIVSRGLEQLRYINAEIVGVILNNLRLGRGRYYPGYYHYYYYYSSHYGADERTIEAAEEVPVARPPEDDAAEGPKA